MLARTAIFFDRNVGFHRPRSRPKIAGRSAKVVKDGVSCNEFAQPLKQVFGQSVGVRAMSHHFRRDCFQY